MFGAGVVVGADVVDGVELGADVVDGVELGADEVVSVVCSGLVSTNGLPDVELKPFELVVGAEVVVLVVEPVVDDDTPNKLAIVEIIDDAPDDVDVVVVVEEFAVEDNVDVDAF